MSPRDHLRRASAALALALVTTSAHAQPPPKSARVQVRRDCASPTPYSVHLSASGGFKLNARAPLDERLVLRVAGARFGGARWRHVDTHTASHTFAAADTAEAAQRVRGHLRALLCRDDRCLIFERVVIWERCPLEPSS